MIFVRNNFKQDEKCAEEIKTYVMGLAKEGLATIEKDDCVSFKARVAKGKRAKFSVQFGGIIVRGKELSLVNHHKCIKEDEDGCMYADELNYSYMFLDDTGFDLQRMDITWENDMSVDYDW